MPGEDGPMGEPLDSNRMAAPVAPPLTMFLSGLDRDEVIAGKWTDRFLTLGGRLRAIYGDDVSLAAAEACYVVRVRGVQVALACDEASGDGVWVTARAGTRAECRGNAAEPLLLEVDGVAHAVEFAIHDATAWFTYELPFSGSHSPQLRRAVIAVARAMMCWSDRVGVGASGA
jgi:hypothetical protein